MNINSAQFRNARNSDVVSGYCHRSLINDFKKYAARLQARIRRLETDNEYLLFECEDPEVKRLSARNVQLRNKVDTLYLRINSLNEQNKRLMEENITLRRNLAEYGERVADSVPACQG